jgi:hypothetical protein
MVLGTTRVAFEPEQKGRPEISGRPESDRMGRARAYATRSTISGGGVGRFGARR